jgi:UDP-N-acetylmuramate-alanine ligase
MSGIAEVLANLGYEVSGSDAKTSDVTDRLARLRVRIEHGHAASHVGNADVVVTRRRSVRGIPKWRKHAGAGFRSFRAPKCSRS